jgi:hypothetical protein
MYVLVVVILVAVIGGVYYMRKQRSHVVKALAKAEEGERRNYKIDYSHLSVKTVIGAGGFGFVYRGEYPFYLFIYLSTSFTLN